MPPVVDRASVSHELLTRTGYELGSDCRESTIVWPNGASLRDGLDEDEAVLLALWNNAAFRELLVDLDIAHADLVQAGLLPNPEFAYLFGMPGKALRYAIEMPLEALWLRPIRLRAARRDSAQAGHRVAQAALDLIRDVRQAYADLQVSNGRLTVAEEAVRLRRDIARIAEKRREAGDISPQEAATARIDALRAEQDIARARYDIYQAEVRLRNVMGLDQTRSRIVLRSVAPPLQPELCVDELVEHALASRPDAQAANDGVAAAAERLRLSRVGWIRYFGILDATAGQITGHEFGPGLRVTLPIFNRNQGMVLRAAAELDKAERQRETILQQIAREVHHSYLGYRQARSELAVLEEKVLPEVQVAIDRAERAYREGDTSFAVVLETSRQLIVSRLRQVELEAELLRSWAELERSVGCKIKSANGRRTRP